MVGRMRAIPNTRHNPCNAELEGHFLTKEIREFRKAMKTARIMLRLIELLWQCRELERTRFHTHPDVDDEAKPSFVARAYITSLLTYTVLSEDQGYHDDNKQTGGSEYHRLQSHKTGLGSLSALLEQQTINSSSQLMRQTQRRSRLEWRGNMVNLGAKIGGLCKEMKWTEKVFREGHKEDDP
ncbi:MAG: hypothetical protein Q9198_004718 [Flavoplaca austrocitrina]